MMKTKLGAIIHEACTHESKTNQTNCMQQLFKGRASSGAVDGLNVDPIPIINYQRGEERA